jgi:hypothetical protein
LGTKGAVSFGPKIFFMFIPPPSARKRRKLEVGAGLAFLRTKMAKVNGKSILWKKIYDAHDRFLLAKGIH